MTAIRRLFSSDLLTIGFVCLWVVSPSVSTLAADNPLRPSEPRVAPASYLPAKSSTVAPWVEPDAPEPDPPLEMLAPGAPTAPLPAPVMQPPPPTDETYWPDETYDHDPAYDRGPVREHLARWRQSIRNHWGLGGEARERFLGPGDPLIDSSWLNRPWSFGAIIGQRFHDHLLDGRLAQGNSTNLGLRLGWDFDYYWGLEGRYSFSNPNTFVPGTTIALGHSFNYFADVSLMHYPWGDSAWRPYASIGLGSATYRFNGVGIAVSDSALYVPIGVGLKYYYAPYFTLRLDAAYEWTPGTNSLDSQNMFTIGAAAEIRFGGRRRSYFPWDGGTTFW